MKNLKPLKQIDFNMKIIKDLGLENPTENSNYKKRMVVFECSRCEKHMRMAMSNVLRLNTKYCKSCSNQLNFTYVEDEHKSLSSVLSGMKSRCYNKNDEAYVNYGGRGIAICKEWMNNSMSFYTWSIANGYIKGLTIDRENNDKGYSPDNCRFTTRTIQNRNTRKIQKNNTSGYRGVKKSTKCKSYVAMICVNYKEIYLGSFKEKIDAAKAFDKYILDNNLEHTPNGVL